MRHATRTAKGRQGSFLPSSRRSDQAANLLQQNAVHMPIVLVLGLFGAAVAGDAHAGCNGSPSQSYSGGDFGYTWSACWGDNGVDKSGEKDGSWAQNIAIETHGTYTAGSSLPYTVPWNSVGGVIMAYTMGGAGVDEGNAGWGGTINITSYGDMTLTSADDPGSIGSLISATSLGGYGDSDNDNYKSSGGDGGYGNYIGITNSGTLTVDSVIGGQDRGMSGILAVSQGGNGGEQYSGVAGDQVGGAGGPGWEIVINNSGQVNLGSAANPLNGLNYAWGVAAESIGGMGGNDNGAGGQGSEISIKNGSTGGASIGAIAVYSDGDSVRGIYAMSQGAEGTASHDSSDNGGNGADGGQINISSYSDITVVATGEVNELSGGIVAVSQGGNGGDGTESTTGGRGGNGSAYTTTLTVQSGSTISTQGDYVVGVVGLARGGNGGDGGDNEKDSSGGRGGDVSAIQMNVYGVIQTDGHHAYGLLGESVGGQGGNGSDASAPIGTSGGGGYGGNANGVGAYMTGGSKITTTGDFSAAVTLHSVGGGGGTGGDFTDVLGGGAGNGGNGGNGETATINNAGGTITTLGDHSYGILVQSIGGSGGTGGIADGLTLELGGDGGDSGTSGTASVQNTGTITTSGYSAHGVLAQSISGGGGAAGMAGGTLSIGGSGGTAHNAGNAKVQNSGTITTNGDAAIGIMAQSIGGGGGTGGGAKGIATVGGSGGAGGGGTHADVWLIGGSVTTYGEMAHGIMAQSIGGGGGNGGDVIDMSVAVPSLGVGGTASQAGTGGWACVTNKNTNDSTDDDSCSTGVETAQPVTIATSGSGALGILAQSVGGGGGNGGNATGADAGLGSFQIGGGAGGGGYANTVTVGFQGLTLTTQGSHAAGIVAQSVGGGGGTGGSASSYDGDIAFAASVAVGGSGGNGGTGGKVFVNLTDSTVETGQGQGDITDAIGVLAQSIGGGGGSGGSSVAEALAAAVPTGDDVSLAMSISTAVGGTGGSGGYGEDVTLTLDGSTLISTKGASSHGVVAQSIGGGGGNGGSASSMSATAGIENTASADIGVSVGGNGSAGGYGGPVTVTLKDSASVLTVGDYANAIVAQSIGGGGGNGGVGSVNSDQIGGGFNLSATVGVGGKGSGGGNGGTATVDLESGTYLRTIGSGARGVLVQSIGGGGGASQGVSVGLSASDSLAGDEEEGSGAFSAAVDVSVGRTGGSGGEANTVDVTTKGKIDTFGADADGVLAQSIGGGGGLGGSVGQASSDDSEPLHDDGDSECDSDGDDSNGDGGHGYCFSVSVGATIDDGGSGGTAAGGNTVTLTHYGQIKTRGDWADGIVAQSIGGGGGAGGTSTASGSQATANITVGVGGSGGAGGDGGEVDVTFNSDNGTASITTTGYSAYGALLQSIGGGGGQGGDGSDEAAGKITVGGGFGGSGGGGGNGGKITVGKASWASLTTTGDDSIGLLAQSIGGGGGVGGAGSSKAADDDDSHSIDLVVGGSGGIGGHGGEIDLNYGGSVDTSGNRAHGIVAQSIGGGGGIGGAGEADSIASLVVGGAGGGDIDGGHVTANLMAGSTIHTRGIAAHGLVAQSIGGGGGIGGTASGAPLSLKGSSPGSYGDGVGVSVTVNGAIITEGDYSYGVLAQSIGGGGGFGGNAAGAFMGSNGNLSSDGQSGGVYVDLNSGRNIQATGEDSVGIFAQSDAGTENNGEIDVYVNGSVTGGSGDNGAGVWIAGGKKNTLTVNVGYDSAGNVSIGSITAASGVAVRYTPGMTNPDGSTLTLFNYGTVSGSVEGADVVGNQPTDTMSATSAEISTAGAAPAAAHFGHDMPISVLNETGGLLTDATIYEADVVNHGRLMIGHSGDIDATRITGDLTQAADGVLALNADFAAIRGDRLTIDGDAVLAGKIDVVASSLLPGRTLPFLTAGGTLTHSLSATSPIFDYAISQDGNELSVSAQSADLDAAALALNESQDEVADHLQAIWDVGGGSFGTLFGTLDSLAKGDSDDYASALSDITFGAAGAAAAGSIAMTQQHLGLLLSCPMFAPGTSFLVETSCVWGQAGAQTLDQKADGGISGFDANTYAMQGGAQFELSPGWFLGIAGGYDRSAIRADDGRVESDGDILYAGLSLKHEIGPWQLSAAVAGSYGWYDNTRMIRIPGFAGEAEGEPDIYNVSARMRAAYTFARDPYYVRPLLDLDLIYSHADGYGESGAGLLDLAVDDASQWSFHATPAIEVGTRVAVSETMVMRAFAGAGVTFSNVDNWKTSVRLADAPSGIGTFDSEVPLAEVTGRLTAGLDFANDNGFGLRVEYQGSFSDTSTSHGGSLRLNYKF